jgi:hypothetical protein
VPISKPETRFEELRSLLEQAVQEHGLNHPDVLRLSQELDKIHNELLDE